MTNFKVLTGILAVALFLGLTGVVVASDTDEFNTYTLDKTSAVENNSTSQDAERTNSSKDVEKINPLFCTLDLVNQNEAMMVNDCTRDDLMINSG